MSPPKKEENVKDCEQLLWVKVQSQNKLAFELQVSQQQTMLLEVRSKLEVVNDEVCALRALVADPSVPAGPTPEPPSLD